MAAGGVSMEELQAQIAEIRQTSWEAQERAARLQNEVDTLRQQLSQLQKKKGAKTPNTPQPPKDEVAALKETVQALQKDRDALKESLDNQVAANQRLQWQLNELRPRAGALQLDQSDTAFNSSSMHLVDDSTFFRDQSSQSTSSVVNHLSTPTHQFNQPAHLGEIGAQQMQAGLPPLNLFMRYVPIPIPTPTNHYEGNSEGGQSHVAKKKRVSKEPDHRDESVVLGSGTRGAAKRKRAAHTYNDSTDGDDGGIGELETGGEIGTSTDEFGEGWMDATSGTAQGWTCTANGFTCNKCSKFFKHRRDMERHCRTHTGEKPYRCPVRGCGRRFAQSGTLGQHMVVHTGARPYVCPHEGCGIRFTQSGAMKNHARLHTGEKPFVCDVEGCGAAFSRRDNLSRHSRVHTGERPHECSICAARFTNSTTLSIHMRTHTHERPYKCPAEDCGMWFVQHSHARRHAARKHGIGVCAESIAASKRLEVRRGMESGTGGKNTKKGKGSGRKDEGKNGEVGGAEGRESRGDSEMDEGDEGVMESLGHVS